MSSTSNNDNKKTRRRSSHYRNNNSNNDDTGTTAPHSMPIQSSLRVEEEEQSDRQQQSLKPPPRTTVTVNDSKNDRISVPASITMDSMDNTVGVGEPLQQPSSPRPLLDSSSISSSRRQNSYNNSSSSIPVTTSPSQQRPRRAGRRPDKIDLEDNTPNPNSPRTTKKKQKRQQRQAEQSSSPSSVKTRSKLSSRDVNPRMNSEVLSGLDQGTTTTTEETIVLATSITTHDSGGDASGNVVATAQPTITPSDTLRSEKRKARREAEGLPLQEDDEAKPPAAPVAPGAFCVTPTGGAVGTTATTTTGSSVGSINLQDDHHFTVVADEELSGSDGQTIVTAPVAPVTLAAAAMPPQGQPPDLDYLPSKVAWRDTGLEEGTEYFDGHNKRASALHALRNDGTAIPITAELVPDEEELERRMEEKMQERLKKELETRLEKERKRHVVAEAVHVDKGNNRSSGADDEQYPSSPSDGAPPKRRIRTWTIVAAVVVGIVVLLSAIVGGVVSKKNFEPAPTMAPTIATTETYQEMVDTIGGMVASDPTVFFTSMNTPQYKAMDWLANNDTWTTTVDRSPVLLAERYALVLLYFATDGPNWKEQYFFLESTSVCTWNDGSDLWASNVTWLEASGVFCGADELVQEMWLGAICNDT
jgi:hypothetical protein